MSQLPKKEIPNIYIDGLCITTSRGENRAGIGVFWTINDYRNLSKPLKGRQTHKRADIWSAILGVHQAIELGYEQVNIFTDSKYVIDCINDLIPVWKYNSWRNADGNSIVNRDDYEQLDFGLHQIRVNWNLISPHAGIRGNEEAEQLAKQAIKI